MTPNQFLMTYGTPPPQGFLERLNQIIPPQWLRYLSVVDSLFPAHSLVVRNEKGDWVDFRVQTAKNFYRIFESRRGDVYSIPDRWLKAYNGDETFAHGPNWQEWYLLPYRLSHEVQLQSFVFRLLYRVIPCKVYLAQLKIADSDACSRCAEREDLFHLFFECPCVKEFWDSLASWLGGKEGVREFPDDLSEEEFMLGIVDRKGDYSLINYIILCAKFYIYKVSVFNLGEPDLLQFLVELKNRLEIERLCSLAGTSYRERFKKWMSFFQDF